MRVRDWIVKGEKEEVGLAKGVKEEGEEERSTQRSVQGLRPASGPVTEQSGRKERRDKGSVLITERDERLLRWIGEQYAVRLDQLQVLLGRQAQAETQRADLVSEGTARRVVARWVKAGWAERRKFGHREPEWVWPTSKGMQVADLEYRALEPSLALLKHTYEVNRIRLSTEERLGTEAVWKSERMIKPIRQRDVAVHYADAEVEIRGRTIGLEIERTAKGPVVLRSILAGLVREYKYVWYFVAPPAMSGVLRAVQALPDGERRQIALYDLETITEIRP